MNAKEYVKSRMGEWNVRHLADKLDAIYQGVMIELMESYHQHRLSETPDISGEEIEIKELDLLSEIGKRACPCNYGKPCKQTCTCANPLMSGGCDCCATYGSAEQREYSAERIKAILSKTRNETPPKDEAKGVKKRKSRSISEDLKLTQDELELITKHRISKLPSNEKEKIKAVLNEEAKGVSNTFEQCLREEFLVNTQNYPKEYHELFHKKFKRAEQRFKELNNT